MIAMGIGFGVALTLVVILQICALCKTATRKQVAELNQANENVWHKIKFIERDMEVINESIENLRRNIHNEISSLSNEQGNSKLIEAVDRLAHGANERNYSMFKELVEAVDANDVGKLTNVVRGAKFVCSQYEKADAFKLGK